MSRFVLVSTDEDFETRLRAVLSSPDAVVTRIGSPADLEEALKSTPPPDVVGLGPGVPVPEALALASQLELDHPEVNVVLVADTTERLWEQALRAGVRDVVPPGTADVELREAFDRAADTAARRRAKLVGETTPEVRRSRIVTIVSPKGGAGKTTIATNMAAALAGSAPGRVALVDADLQFGDVAGAMALTPEYSVADAARLNGALDAMALKVFLTRHPDDLFALCAPESPAEGEQIRGEAVGRIIELLALEFDYVIVDTSGGLSEHTLSAIEVATDVVLVCSMDVPSVRSTRKVLDALSQLGMSAQRRHLVLNRADAKVGLDAADVEAALEMLVDVTIPNSRGIALALNQGIPVVHTEPRSPAARQLRELAQRFVAATPSAAPPAAPAASGRLFSRRGSR